jgi:sterol desaturase/sphingolipid hydroxylase (fatty acid hydroxylase superfamily)
MERQRIQVALPGDEDRHRRMPAPFTTLLLSCAPVVLFLIIAVSVEFASPRQHYSLRQRFPGALWLAIQPALFILAAYPVTGLWKQLDVKPVIDLVPLGFWVGTAVMLLVFDLLRYLVHRLEHSALWPVHAVHHSIRELHAANSFAHPLEGLVEAVCIIIPLSLIRAPHEVMLAVGGITGFQNVIIHSPTRLHLGPLRAILVDNRFHRIHHSLEPQHHDRNFGFLFSFWDRLLGTVHEPEPGEWPETGVENVAPPHGFIDMLAHPLQHFRQRHVLKPARQPKG